MPAGSFWPARCRRPASDRRLGQSESRHKGLARFKIAIQQSEDGADHHPNNRPGEVDLDSPELVILPMSAPSCSGASTPTGSARNLVEPLIAPTTLRCIVLAEAFAIEDRETYWLSQPGSLGCSRRATIAHVWQACSCFLMRWDLALEAAS